MINLLKIHFIFFFVILINVNLKAYYIEDMNYGQIKKASQCALDYALIYKDIGKALDNLNEYLRFKIEIENKKELKLLFHKNNLSKKKNFKSFIKGYKKIKEYFYKQHLDEKYNIPKLWQEVFFDDSLFETHNAKEFKIQQKKVELLKLVIQPLIEQNSSIMINCMPKHL